MKKKESNQEKHYIDKNKNLIDQLITIGTSAGSAKVIIMEGICKQSWTCPRAS